MRFKYRKRTKFHSIATEVDGIRFASKAEAALYVYLKATLFPSRIALQPKIYLTRAKILYKPDFECDGVYYEMKGFATPSFNLKKRLWTYYGAGNLHIFKMKGSKPALDEIVFLETDTI